MTTAKRPGGPFRHDGPTRVLMVQIDEDLYFRLSHISMTTRIPKWRLVESGLKMKFRQLQTRWPAEWLKGPAVPEPHEIPDDLDKDE